MSHPEDSLSYVRSTYGIDVRLGQTVTYRGVFATVICGSNNLHLQTFPPNARQMRVHPEDPDLNLTPTIPTQAATTASTAPKGATMNHLNHEDVAWVLRLIPAAWRELMKERPNQLFLAGGAIRSAILREPINDVDFFTPTADAAEACARKLAMAAGVKLHSTQYAHTVCTRPFPAQFIHRWTFQDPEAAVQSFDFTIARAAIWWDGQRWASTCDDRYYNDLAAKRLVYCAPDRDEEAGGSMLRVLKFYQRGYRIPLDSLGAVIARLCWKVEEPAFRSQEQLGRVLTGLLVEVDPSIDPTHDAHLPTTTGPSDTPEAQEAKAKREEEATQDVEQEGGR